MSTLVTEAIIKYISNKVEFLSYIKNNFIQHEIDKSHFSFLGRVLVSKEIYKENYSFQRPFSTITYGKNGITMRFEWTEISEINEDFVYIVDKNSVEELNYLYYSSIRSKIKQNLPSTSLIVDLPSEIGKITQSQAKSFIDDFLTKVRANNLL